MVADYFSERWENRGLDGTVGYQNGNLAFVCPSLFATADAGPSDPLVAAIADTLVACRDDRGRRRRPRHYSAQGDQRWRRRRRR